MNVRQGSGAPSVSGNVQNVEGFRASSDVGKSYMQEPALGSLWSMGILDSGGAIGANM